MNITVEAVFDGTTFKPVESIQIAPNTRVLLTIRDDSGFISASEAKRAANRALLRDLVGTALYSGTPIWVAEPTPHWQIPYRLFDGTPFVIIDVDAKTAQAKLTSQERDVILARLESIVNQDHAPA